MHAPAQNPSTTPQLPGSPWKRRLAKTLLFSGVVFFVLNPNVRRAFLQVQHVLHPESLIQTNFAALPHINAEIDRVLASRRKPCSEARLVAKTVLRDIPYATDYETWLNLEYWPTAEEVWAKGREDCDGRAILTTSILRSRGFQSAGLVVGLDHMWVLVDENEKNPGLPPHYIALLSPNPEFSLEVSEESRWSDFVRLTRALLHPTALRETSSHLFADIPALRKSLLIVVLLVLCYHPCRSRTGILLVVGMGLGAAALLRTWQPDDGPSWSGWLGWLLLGLAFSSALLGEKVRRAKCLNRFPGCMSPASASQ